MRSQFKVYYFFALILSLCLAGYTYVSAEQDLNGPGASLKEGNKKIDSSGKVSTFDSAYNSATEFTKSGISKLKVMILGEPETPPASPATKEELNSIDALGLKGEIVFDSNRDSKSLKAPNFGIYALSLKDQSIRAVINSSKQDIYPDVSPDSKYIVFARAETLDRDSDSEIWLMKKDGTENRKIGVGTFPTFSADGNKIFYEFKRSKVLEYDLKTEMERQIFPSAGSPFENKKIVKPRLSSDQKVLYFTSDVGGRWTAWSFNLETKANYVIGKGCEPAPFKNESSAAWIRRNKMKAGSGISKFNLLNQKNEVLEDKGEEFKNLGFGHEYFPTLAAQDKFLIYSACPAEQHDHYKANYQLFIKDLANSKTTRLSFDEFTNRWPKFLGE